MPSIIVSTGVVMGFISGIMAQGKNVTVLDFENDFGGWNISLGNWNRSTLREIIRQWISKLF